MLFNFSNFLAYNLKPFFTYASLHVKILNNTKRKLKNDKNFK